MASTDDEARYINPFEKGESRGPIQFFGPRNHKMETPGGIVTSTIEHTFDVSQEVRAATKPQVPLADARERQPGEPHPAEGQPVPNPESGDSESGSEADAEGD